ncbi:hypothetical protein HYV56_00920 [Candidatus Peregrinibacteria bacterium]|nr:hypothetical protein [Candidatus Peregrinibacteria bacterium]
MIIFFLIGSVIMTAVILILAFENIAAICTYLNFFFIPVGTDMSPTFLVLANSFLGIITGMFYFGLFYSLFRSKSKENDLEDENF